MACGYIVIFVTTALQSETLREGALSVLWPSVIRKKLPAV